MWVLTLSPLIAWSPHPRRTSRWKGSNGRFEAYKTINQRVLIDMVTVDLIKLGGISFWGSFWFLWNLCWGTGRVQKDWKHAVIVALHKGKGSRIDCTNYRAGIRKKYRNHRISILLRITITEPSVWSASSSETSGLEKFRGFYHEISIIISTDRDLERDNKSEIASSRD